MKVLESCVVSSLLFNCECFGSHVPEGLESLYHKMIKSCLGVKNSVPNEVVLIESGMPSLCALIYSRQFNFVQRFTSSLADESPRKLVMNHIWNHQYEFTDHYKNLVSNYRTKDEILNKFDNELKRKICMYANDDHYKYLLYKQFNPDLVKPDLSFTFSTKFVRLRLSSHDMPIERDRYQRIPRTSRLCQHCNVLGDERHYIYSCSQIDRSNLNNIPSLDELSNFEQLELLLNKLQMYL